MLDLTQIKIYLRLEEDYSEEDELLSSLLIFSQEYIKNATGKTVEGFGANPIYQLAQKMLVGHIYENRLPTNDTERKISKEVRFSLDSILSQIQYAYE